MDYIRLGKTGVKVSRICLGCMSYGEPNRGGHPWSIGLDDSRPFFRKAIEAGINFFDTANVYSDGSSEEITGKLLKEFAPRDEIVLATKVHGRMRKDPNGRGLSRKAIFTEIDKSLQRLGVDYVDLYQIHRWDYETPIEETLQALHDVVKSGKTRYIGASSMHAWQFAKALYLADLHGWTRFVSMQNHYNLLNREEEREMMKLCAAEGVGVIPWSPMARGRLVRSADQTSESGRPKTDDLANKLYSKINESDHAIIEAVAALAAQRNVSKAEVALAWHFSKPYITAPIIGATKLKHLEDAIAAVSLKLSPEEIQALEAPYVPHLVKGFE
jgi:aryl-alcohol dehydrogenase-like predicted oxidoreductase